MFERFTHTTALILQANLAEVLPLFGPMREKEWAEGWNPTLIYSESPLGDQAGTVFTVSHADGTTAVWHLNRFEDDTVEYVCIVPDHFVKVVHIVCQPLPDHRTQALVTYTYTALSPAGNTALHHLRHHHAAMVASWEAAINRCLG